MIFLDILKKTSEQIAPEIDRLFQLALANQQHEGDLLLFYVNGFYDESALEWNIQGKKFSHINLARDIKDIRKIYTIDLLINTEILT